MKPRVKAPFLVSALAALALASAPAAQAASEVLAAPTSTVGIEAGQARLVRLDRAAASVFIADPNIADVQVKSPTLIYVVAKKVGTTSLYAVDAQDQVVASLELSVAYDEARLREALKRQAPDSQIEVSTANDALILSGRVASAAQGEDILRTAAQFLPGDAREKSTRLINRLTVDAPNQVNLRVRVAEVSRDASQVLGFNWDAIGKAGSFAFGLATGAPVFTSAAKTALARGADGAGDYYAGLKSGNADVNVLIDALQQKNLVTVLAEPNLTAVSGEPANFLAGGEYPIPVPQGLNTVTIEYKKFGVSLAFVATILDGGRISLNVKPEVSQLSQSGAITLNGINVPALTTRRAETTVELGSGQSFAIAGLLQNNVSQELSKFPGLGDTPVLGALFRSKRFQNNQSELVIIVTPYLVKPVNQHLATPPDLFAAAASAAAAEARPPEKS